MVSRGDVWLAALDPTIGHEIQKTRPCLVISPNEMNDYLNVVLVAPMTSGSRPAAFRVPAAFRGIDGFILLEQTRALDKRRLIKQLGRMDETTMSETLKVLRDLYDE